MKSISLVRYSPHDQVHAITTQVVECYREVFSDTPWHEWLRCAVCNKYWGACDRALLASYQFRHCDTPLVDFWPREQVIADLFHEIAPDSSCWIAMEECRVVGFCWGYPITLQELENKLGNTFSHAVGIPVESTQLVAYQDEVGVLSAYRGRKIAKKMVALRLIDFKAKNLEFAVVRTRQYPEPSETFLWYTKKLGYRILASYPDADGRVILGRNLLGLLDLLTL